MFRLVNHYLESGNRLSSVVSLRSRRFGFCTCTDNTHITQRHDMKISHTNNSNGNSSNRNSMHIKTTSRKNKPSRNETSIDSRGISKIKVTIHSTSRWNLTNYGFCRWPRIQNSKSEFLVLPTGNGGILYHPRFFHKIVFDPILRNLTRYNDDLTFRLETDTC